MWWKDPNWLVQAAVAVATFLVAVIAVYGDALKRHLLPPKLSLRLKSESGELTTLSLHDPFIDRVSKAMGRYFHLSVVNDGFSIATNTGVYLTSIMLRGAGGDWHQKWNGDALLSWRNGALYPVLREIGSTPIDADFCYLVESKWLELKQSSWFGFKHVIFDDNYPVMRGDCYSLKKVFASAGFQPTPVPQRNTKSGILSRLLRRSARMVGLQPIAPPLCDVAPGIPPNEIDARMLKKHLEIYYEFPPILKTNETRWGDKWDELSYPTPEPLLDKPVKPAYEIFMDEAAAYTWICYAKLR